MSDQRKVPRYSTSAARVYIGGISEVEAVLEDISIAGCCVECNKAPNIEQNTKYKIKIVPEEKANIGGFEIVTESKWIYKKDSSCKIGFFIWESPKGESFQRYVDYLAWHSSISK
jgi:hypothetical protein